MSLRRRVNECRRVVRDKDCRGCVAYHRGGDFTLSRNDVVDVLTTHFALCEQGGEVGVVHAAKCVV